MGCVFQVAALGGGTWISESLMQTKCLPELSSFEQEAGAFSSSFHEGLRAVLTVLSARASRRHSNQLAELQLPGEPGGRRVEAGLADAWSGAEVGMCGTAHPLPKLQSDGQLVCLPCLGQSPWGICWGSLEEGQLLTMAPPSPRTPPASLC